MGLAAVVVARDAVQRLALQSAQADSTVRDFLDVLVDADRTVYTFGAEPGAVQDSAHRFHFHHAVSLPRRAGMSISLSAGELAVLQKSAETPMLEATPDLLGPHGLWHTPDRHVHTPQKLPNYIEHIAHALMRDQGMGEQQAIATAINAVKRWAKGDLRWGKKKITPEVIRASRRALKEWEDLKASHH